MAYGMHAKFESTAGLFPHIDLSRLFDAWEGEQHVAVTPVAAYECDCDVDMLTVNERFWSFCAFMNYPHEPDPGLKLTITLKV